MTYNNSLSFQTVIQAPVDLYHEIKSSFGNSSHRFLDHKRGPDAPLDGKNLTLRAAVTPDGYCVEHRETLR